MKRLLLARYLRVEAIASIILLGVMGGVFGVKAIEEGGTNVLYDLVVGVSLAAVAVVLIRPLLKR